MGHCFSSQTDSTVTPETKNPVWPFVNKKRKLFLGYPTTSRTLCLRHRLEEYCYPDSRSQLWNINHIPFRWKEEFDREDFLRSAHLFTIHTDFSHLLGPTNPWSTAVLTKPFSTSVFKDLTWILATTTKICTMGCSTKIYIQRLLRNERETIPLLSIPYVPPTRCCNKPPYHSSSV